MLTVALIGGDGAGKTTIAMSLEQTAQFPVKYVYMGMSAQSSNIKLPTSQLFLYLKRRSYHKMTQESGETPADVIPAEHYEYARKKRGPIWVAARFLNRLAEAWYRQIISFKYNLQGYVVVYDRHFLFDTAPMAMDGQKEEFDEHDRLLYWILKRTYPKPDLAILLDAPAEVLYERKRESTVEELNRRRNAYLEQGNQLDRFVRVDATQPLDKVLADVTQHISSFYAARYRKPNRQRLFSE